jgi:hypothetical protein
MDPMEMNPWLEESKDANNKNSKDSEGQVPSAPEQKVVQHTDQVPQLQNTADILAAVQEQLEELWNRTSENNQADPWGTHEILPLVRALDYHCDQIEACLNDKLSELHSLPVISANEAKISHQKTQVGRLERILARARHDVEVGRNALQNSQSRRRHYHEKVQGLREAAEGMVAENNLVMRRAHEVGKEAARLAEFVGDTQRRISQKEEAMQIKSNDVTAHLTKDIAALRHLLDALASANNRQKDNQSTPFERESEGLEASMSRLQLGKEALRMSESEVPHGDADEWDVIDAGDVPGKKSNAVKEATAAAENAAYKADLKLARASSVTGRITGSIAGGVAKVSSVTGSIAGGVAGGVTRMLSRRGTNK